MVVDKLQDRINLILLVMVVVKVMHIVRQNVRIIKRTNLLSLSTISALDYSPKKPLKFERKN